MDYFNFSIDEVREFGTIHGLKKENREIPEDFQTIYDNSKKDLDTSNDEQESTYRERIKEAADELIKFEKETESVKQRAQALEEIGITETITGFLIGAGYFSFLAVAWSIKVLLEANVMSKLCSPLNDFVKDVLLSFSKAVATLPLSRQLLVIIILVFLSNYVIKSISSIARIQSLKKSPIFRFMETFHQILIYLLIFSILGLVGISIDNKEIELTDASYWVVGTVLAVVTTSVFILLLYSIGAGKNKTVLNRNGVWIILILGLISVTSLGVLPISFPIEGRGSAFSITLLAIYLITSSLCLAIGLIQKGLFRDKSKREFEINNKKGNLIKLNKEKEEIQNNFKEAQKQLEKEYYQIKLEFLNAYDQARLFFDQDELLCSVQKLPE